MRFVLSFLSVGGGGSVEPEHKPEIAEESTQKITVIRGKTSASIDTVNTLEKTANVASHALKAKLSNDLEFLKNLKSGTVKLNREGLVHYQDIKNMIVNYPDRFSEKLQEIFNMMVGLENNDHFKRNLINLGSVIQSENEDLQFLKGIDLPSFYGHLDFKRFNNLVHKYQAASKHPEQKAIHLEIRNILKDKNFSDHYLGWINEQNGTSLPSEITKINEYIPFGEISDIQTLCSLVNIYEIVLVAEKYNLNPNGLFNDKLLSMKETIDRAFTRENFQSEVIEVLKNEHNDLKVMNTINSLKQYPFDEKFIQIIEGISSERSLKLCLSIDKIPQEHAYSMDRKYIIDRAKDFGLYFEESELASDSKTRYENLLKEIEEKGANAVILSGGRTFNCEFDAGKILIEDFQGSNEENCPAILKESYFAAFDTIEKAAHFLSVNMDPESMSMSFGIYLTPQYLSYDPNSDDLKFINSFDINNHSFEDLQRIGEIAEKSFSIFEYHQRTIDKIYKRLCSLFENTYQHDKGGFDKLLTSLSNEDPSKVFKLMAQLKSLPLNKLVAKEIKDEFSKIEVKLANDFLFKMRTADSGMNQQTFSDPTLGVYEGGANYCCGSVTVAALLNAKHKTNKSIQDLLKEGVKSHINLGQQAMIAPIDLSLIKSPSMNLKLDKVTFEDSKEALSSLPYKRLENFFENEVPKESFGSLVIDTRVLMYMVSKDGSVEVFDSHGSSCPLLVGGITPAYHAIFHTTKAAAYYLSIHSKTETLMPLRFIPVDFLSSE